MNETENDWFGPEAATFGDRVTAARDSAGMTQAQLAKRLGVKKTTVRGWEEDLSEPRANKLSMLSGLLNVSIIWLLTGEGEGMETPGSEAEMAGDLVSIMTELRALREDMRAGAERLARLEKKLRLMLEQEQA